MLKKLSENTYFLPHNEETDRPVLGYIMGDEYSLMVDAGNSKAHAELFLKEIGKLNLPYPKFVAITHSHWDHTYGLHGVEAISIALKRTNEYLKSMMSWEWSDSAMEKRLKNGEDIEFCDSMIRKEYKNRSEICVKTADISYEERLSIYLGRINCELMRIDSSHTDDCAVIYIPQEKIIFLGDIISEDFHHGKPVYYKDKMTSLVDTLEDLDFDIGLFGHMEPFAKKDLLYWLKNVTIDIV